MGALQGQGRVGRLPFEQHAAKMAVERGRPTITVTAAVAHRARNDATVLAPVNSASSPSSPRTGPRGEQIAAMWLRVAPGAPWTSAALGGPALARAMGRRIPPAGALDSG